MFARDGRDDAHTRSREAQGDIVGQVRYLRKPHSRRRQDLEHRYDRALPNPGHLRLDIELRERIAQNFRRASSLVVDDPVLTVRIQTEDTLHRNRVGPVFSLGCAARQNPFHRRSLRGFVGFGLGRVGRDLPGRDGYELDRPGAG